MREGQRFLSTASRTVRSNVDTYYEFSGSLVPWSVVPGAGDRPHHERLEREGKLTHFLAQCPDRTQPRMVRMFDPAQG